MVYFTRWKVNGDFINCHNFCCVQYVFILILIYSFGYQKCFFIIRIVVFIRLVFDLNFDNGVY